MEQSRPADWQKTSEILPAAGDSAMQVKVIIYSRGWATPLVGLFSRLAPDSVQWAVYDQQNDRYIELERTPEFWLEFPERPR